MDFCELQLDVAQQKEHDRKVAEAAVAKARLEWERQLSPKQQTAAPAQVIPAPVTTIIHSG